MDNQNQNTQAIKPKKRSAWPIISFLVLLVFLAACGTSIALGVAYVNQNPRNWQNLNFNNNNNNTSNESENKSSGDFTSNEKYIAESDLISLVENSQPAVVTVAVKAPQIRGRAPEIQNRTTVGSGTGFFIAENGLLITNEHVVCGSNASDLLIITSDQKSYTVRTLASDPTQDVAILQVDTKGDKVKTLKFANQDTQLRVGQEVVAIGNPFGDNPGTVTRGIISGTNRNITAQGSCDGQNQLKDYEGVLQTDAAINSGNSGGPLLNLRGEVIGVNSATLRGANNISYTVPFNTVTRILDKYLKNNNRIILPYIGVSHTMIDQEEARSNEIPVGALVRSVVNGSPADQAGVEEGDIITKIGDRSIDFSLVATLNQYFEPGQRTTIEVYRSNQDDLRDGRNITLSITIGDRPL